MMVEFVSTVVCTGSEWCPVDVVTAVGLPWGVCHDGVADGCGMGTAAARERCGGSGTRVCVDTVVCTGSE
eukprot:14535-Eustigmatos_ZCMA.PRE.1